MTDTGFIKATPQNLPEVDFDMYLKYIQENECFHQAEMRGVKLDRSSRPNYGDAAIGFVQLKRESDKCTVRMKICPEHKLHNKLYNVTVVIHETKEVIEVAQCHDCVAAQGGCKHVAAALKWLNRRTEEPASTSTTCYWTGPKLKKIFTTFKDRKLKEIVGNKSESEDANDEEDNTDTQFRCAIARAANASTETHIMHYIQPRLIDKTALGVSIHRLCCSYGGDRTKVNDFLSYITKKLTTEKCNTVFQETKLQSNNPLWHELRYGRITASRLYESAHCHTLDGVLVNSIMGGTIKDTSAMKRGRYLEEHVIKCVEKHLDRKINRSGLILHPDYPAIGASPDGIATDFIIEVKCPSKEHTFNNYYHKCQIVTKYKCQIQVQMLLSKKLKGYFCIAHPDFETSSKVTVVEEKFDENFILPIVNDAMTFWQNNIFVKLMQNVNF